MSTLTPPEYPAAVLPSDPMLPRPFRILRARAENADTFTLELEPADRGPALTFAPGQFTMLYIFGVGEVPISISGDPSRPQTLVHTVRAVGAVTRAMRQLKPGDMLGVRGPFGAAWPMEAAAGNDVLLIAGGIGLAPLRPALYSLLAQRDRYGKIALLIGARSPEDLIFRKELEKWRSHLDLDVLVTVDHATGAWRGNVGVVTTLIGRAAFDPMHLTAMLCGPEIMMRFTVQELFKREVPAASLYLSMERNMKCALGFCGHCQWGPEFICLDGPVFRYDRLAPLFGKREV
ncbi:MAG TPA: FAD/NAD(P)-binding protein [Chthonomonadaceae bacterium]|nr:FAD/NAD(P)-binding protein [Chthonomonadaceae bacterium]